MGNRDTLISLIFQKLINMEEEYEVGPEVKFVLDSFVLEDGIPQIPTQQMKILVDKLRKTPIEKQKIITAELIAVAIKIQNLGGKDTSKGVAQLFLLAGVVLQTSADILKNMHDGIINVDGQKTVIREGEIIACNVNSNEYHELQEVSAEQAFDRIDKQARFNLKQIEKALNQSREQSKLFFRLTSISAIVGFTIILIGISLIFFKVVKIGIVSTIAGMIPEALALIFYSKDKELRNSIESNNDKMFELQKIQTFLDSATTEKNEKIRCELKKDIIKHTLNNVLLIQKLGNKP